MQSSLLQSYINATRTQNGSGLLNTQNSYSSPNISIAQNPPLNNPRGDEFAQPKEKETKKQKIAKYALLAAVISGSIIGLGASFRKGGGFANTIKNLGTKIKNSFSEGGKANEVIENAKNSDLQNGANNITNAKDTITRHFLFKIPGYKKFDDFTSNIYKKTISKTLFGSYKKADTALSEVSGEINDVISSGKLDEKQSKRLLELLSKKQKAVSEFTSQNAVQSRLDTIDKSLERLDKDGWEKLTEIKNKKNVQNEVKEFSTTSIVKERVEAASQKHQQLIEKYKNGSLSNDEAEELNGLISLLPGGDKISAKLKEADKIYSKAYERESSDLVQKLRDINCGSAPTDIEGMMLTTGALGVYTAQADTKEERTGTLLTTGMPLSVTLGTTIVATCKMISGFKALGLGLATGFIAKRIGNLINNKYQKSHNSENNPKTIYTIDDYKEKAIKDLEKLYA